MNFGKFILQKASKDLILTINETWVAEVILDRFVFMDDVCDYVEYYFVIEDLEKAHWEKVHALAVSDSWELYGECFKNIEQRVPKYLLGLKRESSWDI